MTGALTADHAPGRLCRCCKRLRPFASFVWHDDSGRSGVTGRCTACRGPGRAKAWNPTLPLLRYPITRHAARRYLERVRPDLTEQLPWQRALLTARRDMRVLMADAEFRTEWPAWVRADSRRHGDDTVGFLLVGDALFIVSTDPDPSKRVIVTVLTPDAAETDQRKVA